jgi:Uma2 family endonuclease
MIANTAFRSDERFTQKQFRRWVEQRPRSDINRYELIDGRIVMTPPAGWTHSSLASTLGLLINQHVRNRKLGKVFESSAGYDLPSGDTVEPDLTFVSAERFAAAVPSTPDQFLRVVPNLVVEILSPSTARRDQTEKKDIYARNGVHEYWIVDPRRKLVTVFHLGNREYDAGQMFTTGTLRSKVLPKLRIAVEKLFAL